MGTEDRGRQMKDRLEELLMTHEETLVNPESVVLIRGREGDSASNIEQTIIDLKGELYEKVGIVLAGSVKVALGPGKHLAKTERREKQSRGNYLSEQEIAALFGDMKRVKDNGKKRHYFPPRVRVPNMGNSLPKFGVRPGDKMKKIRLDEIADTQPWLAEFIEKYRGTYLEDGMTFGEFFVYLTRLPERGPLFRGVALDGIYSEHYAGREPDYRDPRRALATAYNNSGNELLPLLKLDQQERDPRYLARRLMYGDDYSGSMNTAVNKIKKPYEAVRTNTFRKGECYAVMVWYLDGKVGDHKLSHTYLCMVENGVRINNDTVILRTHSKTRYYLKEDGLYKGPDDAKTEAQGKIQIIQLKPPGLN